MTVTLCDGGVRSQRGREKVQEGREIFSASGSVHRPRLRHASPCSRADHQQSQLYLNIDIMDIWIILGLMFFLPLVLFIGELLSSVWYDLG